MILAGFEPAAFCDFCKADALPLRYRILVIMKFSSFFHAHAGGRVMACDPDFLVGFRHLATAY